jgi:hypothetical protein
MGRMKLAKVNKNPANCQIINLKTPKTLEPNINVILPE